MTSASLSPAVKVSCLVTSCNGSSNDKTGIMESETALLTHPANAPVLPCSPLLSGTVLYECVQDELLEHFKVQGVNKPKHSWGGGLS